MCRRAGRCRWGTSRCGRRRPGPRSRRSRRGRARRRSRASGRRRSGQRSCAARAASGPSKRVVVDMVVVGGSVVVGVRKWSHHLPGTSTTSWYSRARSISPSFTHESVSGSYCTMPWLMHSPLSSQMESPKMVGRPRNCLISLGCTVYRVPWRRRLRLPQLCLNVEPETVADVDAGLAVDFKTRAAGGRSEGRRHRAHALDDERG